MHYIEQKILENNKIREINCMHACYYLILLGTLILLAGLTMLICFVRRYPLPAPGSTGESTNEAP